MFIQGLLPSNKKQWTTDTHNNTDESQNDYAKSKEADKTDTYTVWFHRDIKSRKCKLTNL